MTALTRGGLLGRTEIHRRLEAGELFQKGTWASTCLRPSGYDLRMASDLMLLPKAALNLKRQYKRGEHRQGSVIINPGDTVFVSSAEKLCIPWNISGLVGPKFALASNGILTLTGSILDPGYGLRLDELGHWVPKDDERLHFLLTNVGSGPYALRTGDERIVSLQFFSVEPPLEKKETISIGFLRIEDTFLGQSGAEAGLVFFRNIVEVEKRVVLLEQRNNLLEARLSGIEIGSNQVVMFGIYLICITFLGISFNLLLTLVQEHKLSEEIEALSNLAKTSWPGLILVFLAFIGSMSFGSWLVRSVYVLATRFKRPMSAHLHDR